MHNIVYSPEAYQDIGEIEKFIAKDSTIYAKKVIEKIFFFVNNLSLFPLIGEKISSKLGYRKIVEPTFKYTVIYEYDGKDVYIITISKYKNIVF